MSLAPRWTGSLSRLPAGDRRELVRRVPVGRSSDVTARVEAILGRVERDGDRALVEITREVDAVELRAIEVPRAALREAFDALPKEIAAALARARRNIERAHAAFVPKTIEVETEPGVVVGRRPDPLSAVGVYAPGGRAAYPSSVLMGAVPALVAGVPEIIVCSPPGKDGRPSSVVLAAAHLAGATRVFALGGAHAIGALAFGTETVPKVDRIVGPGNAYVAEAKRQVAGFVGIDSPAGPSEILVVADASATPAAIVREMIAQAEHDPEASCVAVVVGEALARAVLDGLARAEPARAEIVASALSSRGAVLHVDALDEGLTFIAEYAPEHLLLAVSDPDVALPHAIRSGTVFLGESASVAFGDYMTGANHVLPTAGFARSMSGLSTLDYFRFTTYQRVSPEAAARMSADVARLADAEGLPGHAAAARALGGEGGR
ncbi:MAG: histidinol dehydrogenase [Polyangiaceae bacterium]